MTTLTRHQTPLASHAAPHDAPTIVFRCLACRRDWILAGGVGTIECSCGRSRATFDREAVELHGPCKAAWLDDDPGSPRPPGKQAIRRKQVPPLL
ncbi:MAG: hypothetical protein ABI572_07515 [Actinomycetota bacterium]